MIKLFISSLITITIALSAAAQNHILNRNSPLIIDHRSVKEFPNIPQNFIELAATKKLIFLHASVGSTIDNGLNCVQGTRTNPAECKEFPPYKYNRSNWKFQGLEKGGWYGKCDNFTSVVAEQIDNYDIFSFKYCYLEGLDGIMEPCGNPFSGQKVQNAFNYLKNAYETLENKYPDKIFIIWSIPLTQVGQYCTDTLNTLIRRYARENNKILFDIADIETYAPDGKPTKNEQGWELAYKGYCGEQQPGAKSCHPNWTCSIMLAKAFWVMLAKIVGWESTTYTKDEVKIKKFYLYPNPAKDFIFLETADLPIKSELTDIFGNKIMKIESMKLRESIDISNLNNGIYFIRLYYTERIEVEKFMKM